MSQTKKRDKTPPTPDPKKGQKTSETVHLSAEELRKISGGVANPTPGPSKGRTP
jgi:hypothetical protein